MLFFFFLNAAKMRLFANRIVICSQKPLIRQISGRSATIRGRRLGMDTPSVVTLLSINKSAADVLPQRPFYSPVGIDMREEHWGSAEYHVSLITRCNSCNTTFKNWYYIQYVFWHILCLLYKCIGGFIGYKICHLYVIKERRSISLDIDTYV